MCNLWIISIMFVIVYQLNSCICENILLSGDRSYSDLGQCLNGGMSGGTVQVSTRGDPIERTRSYRSAIPSAPLQCNLVRPADRPDHGTKGELIHLLINWFRIKCDRKRIFIYKLTACEVAQQQPGRGRRGPPKPAVPITHPETVTKIFWKVVRSYKHMFVNPYRLVFDDYEYVFTPDKLNGEKGLSLPCDHPDKPGKRVEISFNCHLFFDLDLKGDIDSNPNVQWTSIFMKNLLSQNSRYTPAEEGADPREIEVSKRFAHFGGGMFLIPRTVQAPKAFIEPGVQAWFGLFASVRRMENFDPVINLGLINKLFIRLHLNLIRFYLAINQYKPNMNDMDEEQISLPEHDMCMSPEEADKFTHKLKDIKLKCSCAPGKDKDDMVTGQVERHYRFIKLVVGTRANEEILNVEDPNARESAFKEFRRKDGSTGKMFKRWRKIRMDEWYNAQGMQLKYPSLPLALVKTGKREDLIPMEVLFTHDKPQKYIQLLDFWARMRIPERLARTPADHYRYTKRIMNDKLEYDKDQFMKAMDISMDPKMVECEGRVVEPCTVLGKSDSDESVTKLETKKETGEFFVRRAVETSNKTIRFVVYKLTDAVSDDNVSEFYRELVRKCITRGFDIPKSDHEKPPIRKNAKIDKNDYLQISRMIETDRGVFARWKDKGKPDECLVFLFFTRMFDNLYGEIKYLCDNRYGVVSQVVDELTARKACTKYADETPSDYKSIYHHICLKLNAKLGGINQIVAEPDEPEYGRMPSNERTMFIGIDVIHPSPNSPIRDLSLAAIVASMDKNAAKYAVRIKVNSRCNENVQLFDEHFSILLQQYHAANGFLPDRIVILRDGVSDSEMVKAASMELNSIKVTWKKCANGVKEPPFTYIVCQKRHKTRFYRIPTEMNGEVTNPPMGTVVDKDVVMPHMFDFYMVSHYTQLGTTRPIHYTVVYDDCKSSADMIQEMLFRMCFLYARCSKPVSLPSPVYYAHLACERAAFQHEYALRTGDVKEILDKGVTETVDEYAERVQLQALQIEGKLQVSKLHPGMYFI